VREEDCLGWVDINFRDLLNAPDTDLAYRMVRYKRYAVFLRYQFTRSALIQLEPSNVILSLYHRECEAGIQILQSNGHHHYCQVNVGDSERNEMLEQQQSTLFLRLETDEGSTPSNTTEDSGEKVANKDALAMMLRQPTGGGDEEGEEEDDMFGDDDDIPLEEPSPSTKKGATKAHGRKASKSKSKSGKSEGEHTVCVCACDYVFIRVCVCVCVLLFACASALIPWLTFYISKCAPTSTIKDFHKHIYTLRYGGHAGAGVRHGAVNVAE
jgi:hypothetical protein